MNINEQKFSYLCFALANLLDLLPQFSTASAAPDIYSASSLNIPIYHILPTWNVFAHKNKTIDVTII